MSTPLLDHSSRSGQTSSQAVAGLSTLASSAHSQLLCFQSRSKPRMQEICALCFNEKRNTVERQFGTGFSYWNCMTANHKDFCRRDIVRHGAGAAGTLPGRASPRLMLRSQICFKFRSTDPDWRKPPAVLPGFKPPEAPRQCQRSQTLNPSSLHHWSPSYWLTQCSHVPSFVPRLSSRQLPAVTWTLQPTSIPGLQGSSDPLLYLQPPHLHL